MDIQAQRWLIDLLAGSTPRGFLPEIGADWGTVIGFNINSRGNFVLTIRWKGGNTNEYRAVSELEMALRVLASANS